MDNINQHKILRAPIRILIGVFIVGLMFKIMHWPFSELIISISSGAIMILYIFRFLEKTHKGMLDYVKLALVLSWALNAVFHINHLPYKLIFNVAFSISFLSWLFLGGYQDYYNRLNSKTKKKFDGGILIVGIVITVIGALFKIMHWPGANPMLIIGLSLGALLFMLDFLKRTKK